MHEQTEGNNHTRKLNVPPVLHTTFFLLGEGGGGKNGRLPCRGRKSALFDPLIENYIRDIFCKGIHTGKPRVLIRIDVQGPFTVDTHSCDVTSIGEMFTELLRND